MRGTELKKDDLLTYAGAGRLLGITRGAVFIRYKKNQMPEPDEYLNGHVPAWYESTILKHKQDFKDGRRKGEG